MTSAGLRSFFERCGQAALDAASSPVVAEGAQAYLDALSKASTLDATPTMLPVVEQLLDVELTAPGESFGPLAHRLRWVPSPRGDDPKAEQIALAPLNDHVDLGSVTAGFLVAGANCVYPEHNHSPQELYLTMSGAGSWRYGGNDHYETVEPGSTFYNPPGVIHSARATADQPVLAFYVLWPSAS